MKKVWLPFFIVFYAFAFAGDNKLPSDSLFHVKSTWRTHNDKPIQLKDLQGQGTIITMVYTSCAHACPMMITKIQEVEAALKKSSMKNYKVVIASFDPKKDTPAALKKYVKGRNLDESRWTFLSAPNDRVARELAVVLGISYKEIEGGDFSHSNIITYLDKNGVIKAKLQSLNEDVDPFVESMVRDVH